MKNQLARLFLSVVITSIAFVGRAAAAPPAPGLLAPAAGATVQVPLTISWSAVSDPSGIIAYNWQVSASSSFTAVILQNSTSGQTQDVVSGLANGTYFWRVQAVSGAFVQGAWSSARSFTVNGAGPGAPGTPFLDPTKAYSTFHPFEVITFNWSAVPGATTYVLQAATDPSFPVTTRIQFDNIPTNTFSFAIGNPEGNYSARVFAVNANGIASQPSNVIAFSVFYNNPIGPPPSLVSPANGTTLTLPVTLTWADVPNPQPSGYELQIARDSAFSSIEEDDPQLNGPSRTVLSLTAGTKFWRVRSTQGDASPTTAAVTAWSTPRSFTISSAPPKPVSITLATNPLTSGDTTWVALQLSAAVPASGAAISMTSSNPSAASVPSTITMPGNIAWTQFQMQAGQVVSPTPVTLTATLNGGTASVQFVVQPPALKSLSVTPISISGGVQAGGIVMLTGQAPAGGAVVSLSSNSPAASPPSTVTVPPGSFSASFSVPTSNVTTNTPVTISASWNGVTVQSPITVIPGPVPASLTLLPTTVIGGGPGSVDGTVTIASPASVDQFLQVRSNNPTVLPFLSNSVMVPAGSTRGLIQILPAVVSVPTVVTISVTGSGVTVSANLTVNPSGTPPPPATLSSFTVSPTSVVGGSPATGTVTLPSAAPAGGTVVSLTSNLPGSATVPASVTVAAGATSANFTITTFPSAGTTVQLSATLVDTILFAALGVNPPAASATLSSVTVSPATAVGGNSSTGTVTLSAAAPSGGAVVTLSSSNTAVATVPASVTVAAGSTSKTFTVTTQPVASSTPVTISGSFGGATSSAVLTVAPPPPPASLSAVSVSPTSVTGGATPQGTVTLTSAAPAGGAVVTLSSSNTTAATVPASVTIAAGSTSATFAITTAAVSASTPVTITGSYGGATKTATLTVTPAPPPGQSATLTVTASGRSGERVTSSPAGISVAVGSTGSASFATGTSITLSVSNDRDAIWSGACSSGGNKTKTCTFTLTGAATVTANVQ